MAREVKVISFASEDAERRIVQAIVAIYVLEIQYAGVEGERFLHVSAANGWDDRHERRPRSGYRRHSPHESPKAD
jgi:hypothetical protein